MDLKKFTGLLLAVLTLCAPSATVSNATETINTNQSLSDFLDGTTLDRDGMVTVDGLMLTSPVVSNVSSTLYSSVGNVYTIGGAQIDISAGNTLSLQNINVNNNLSFDANAVLNLDNNVISGTILGSANIYVNGINTVSLSGVTANSLTVSSTGATNLTNTVNLSETYFLSGANVTGTTVNTDQYTQAGAATNVSLNTLNATTNVFVGGAGSSGGNLTANNITTSTYTQMASTVVTDNLTADNVSLNKAGTTGADLTVNNLLTTTGNIDINDSTATVYQIQSTGNLSLNDSTLNLNGNANVTSFSQNNGSSSLNIAAGKTLDAKGTLIINDGTVSLDTGATLKSSLNAAQNNGIEVKGAASINAGETAKKGIISSERYYSQNTSGTVNVAQVFADGDVNISGGTLKAYDIGTTDRKAASYTQSGSSSVTTEQLQTSGVVNVFGGDLTVNDIMGDTGNEIASYSQSTTGTVTIGATGGRGIHSSGNINISAGTLNSYGNLISTTGQYIQSGSSNVNLAAGKKINAHSDIIIENSSVLTLNDNSEVVAGNSFSVNNSAKIIDTSNSGKINITGAYTQTGAASDVQTKYLYASGKVSLTAGNLTAGDVGESTTKRVLSYEQGNVNFAPTATVDNIYAKNVELNNGYLTVNNELNASDNLTLNDGTMDIKNDANIGGFFTQKGGILNIFANKIFNVGNGITTTGGTINLDNNSELKTNMNSANIDISGTTKINTANTKNGKIISSGSYTQSGSAAVYVDSIETAQDINILNGDLVTDTLGTSSNKIGGSYKQSVTSASEVTTSNIYVTKNIEISGGILNLGDTSLVNNSFLSADGNISITGGSILNLYNTTFIASPLVTENKVLTIDGGATLNLHGVSNIGLYDITKNIYSANIGQSNTTTFNIGDNDILNVSAGAGDFLFGTKTNMNISDNGTLNLSAQKGNITFSNASPLNNEGLIDIETNTNKTVTLSNVNTDTNIVGKIKSKGNLNITGNVYTDTFEQTNGKTALTVVKSSLVSENSGNAILINGGSFNLAGEELTVSANNGTFRTQQTSSAPTSIDVTAGTESVITAKTLSINDTALNMSAKTGLTLKPGSENQTGHLEMNNTNTDIGLNSVLTIDTTNGSAEINNSTVSLQSNANMIIQGNTNVNNSNFALNNGATLTLDSDNGDINFDTNSPIQNSGYILVKGDDNEVSLNKMVNFEESKNGSIIKNGKNTLNLNDTVYGDALTVNEGIVNINKDMELTGALLLKGSAQDMKKATINLAEYTTLHTEGDITIGSDADAAKTFLNLDYGSEIAGENILIDAIVNATGARITANKPYNGNVTIAAKTDMTVSHYDGDTGVTVTTITGKDINISGGAKFTVKDGARLEFDGNVISDNAHYDIGYGGNWILTQGSYKNELYTGEQGGAVLKNDGTVTINDNVMFYESSSLNAGGAIYNTGKVEAAYDEEFGEYASNTQFFNNRAGYSQDGNILGTNKNGGALYNTASGYVHLGNDAKFWENKATGTGGAIFNNSDAIIQLEDDAQFTNNLSYRSGGALYNKGIFYSGQNSKFISNRAGFNLLDNRTSAEGGAIFIDNNAMVLLGNNAELSGNMANTRGGAIANYGTLVLNKDYNFDGGNYNAIFFGNGLYETVDGKTYITNQGGVIYNTNTIYTGITDDEGNPSAYTGLYNVKIGSNEEIVNRAITGAGLYNKIAGDSVFYIGKSSFDNNFASTDGGGIYNESGNICIEDNTEFINNRSGERGGAIFNAENNTVEIADNIAFGKEKNGNIADFGGAVYNDGILKFSSGEDTKSVFNSNTASTAGGAIYNNGSFASNNLSNADFINNTSGSTDNEISGHGGAIFNENAVINISNSTFENNSVVYKEAQGGAIYNNYEGTITLGDKAVFKNNSATGTEEDVYTFAQGGAAYNNGTLNVTAGATLENNTTDGKGGAIYNANWSTVNIEKNTVIGGTIENYTDKTEATGGNSAMYGGGIYNDIAILNYDEKDKRNIYFIGNSATRAGGGLYYRVPWTSKLSNFVYYKNSAISGLSEKPGKGGGLYFDGTDTQGEITGKLYVSGSVFEGNSAEIGSAIYNAGTMSIIDNKYIDNKIGSAVGNEGTLHLGIQNFSLITDEVTNNENTTGTFDGSFDGKNAGALWNQGKGVINAFVKMEKGKETDSLYLSEIGYKDNNGNGAVDGAAIHLQDESSINTYAPELGEDGYYKTITVGGKEDYALFNRKETIYKATMNNNVGRNGGALFKSSSKDLTLDDVQFIGNEATASGGAIHNTGANSVPSALKIENNVKFQQNAAKGQGGAIYNGQDGIVEIAEDYVLGENTSGYSNFALDAGGGIANNGILILNSSDNSTRSMYMIYQGGGRQIDSANAYNGRGGALYNGVNGTIYNQYTEEKPGEKPIILVSSGLHDVVFTNNESLYGGALYNESEEGLLSISNTQFSGNRGYYDGGAIYNKQEIGIILDALNNNIFTGNEAGNAIPEIAKSGRGGAIFNNGNIEILNTIPDVKDKDEYISLLPKITPVFVSNRAIGEGGMGGAIYNDADGNININTSNGSIEFNQNSATDKGGAIYSKGNININLVKSEDLEKIYAGPVSVKFTQNTAKQGSAIYLDGGSLLIEGNDENSVTFVDEDVENGIIAQTIAGSGRIVIQGGSVNFFSDASGYGGAYYQTGGIVTSKNKFLNISDSSIRTVTGGTLILDEGAQLVSDYLLISNVESDNNAKIIFNPNTKAKLTDLSALYDNASTFNYFLYTNTDDEQSHKISLRAADVEINDTAVIEKDANVGNAKNSYMVRNLKLSNGAQLDANITVHGGNTIDSVGATLTMGEGALGSDKAGVALKGYNTKLELENTSTEIVFGKNISNDGFNYNNEITKTGAGNVTFKGDNSGYEGVYTQEDGKVTFASGSKYFDADTVSTVNGGTLRIDEKVAFDEGTIIDVNNKATFSTALPATLDLTSESGSILTIEDPNVTVNLEKGTGLEVTNNVKVNAAKDKIYIGGEESQIEKLILGGSSKQGAQTPVTVNQNTKFVLKKNDKITGDSGVLGFGENVVFKDTTGKAATPTVQLKDKTQLLFNNEKDANINLVVQSIDDEENINNKWAETNGDIIKENPGTITVGGNIKDFHGSIVVKDGSIVPSGTQFAKDVPYDLSQISSNADIDLSNITSNNDIVIVGNVSKTGTKYNLDIENTKGNILVKNSANTGYGDIYVTNTSEATLAAKDSTVAKNVYVTGNSILNLDNGNEMKINGNLELKNSTINLFGGNINIAGNYKMGSTVNMMNNEINTQTVGGNMTLTGDSDYKIDISPRFNISDKVVVTGNLASDDAEKTRTLSISDYNILTEPVADYSIFKVFDVKGDITNVKFATTKGTYNSPVASYIFAPSGSNGSYMLARTGYTPTAMSVPAAMQIGGFLSQIQTYDEAFGNLDTVMVLPNAGFNPQTPYGSFNSDDTIVYAPVFIPELEKGVWFRPYGNFEKVGLDNGPDVSNQTYGALVGGDTALKEFSNGFQGTMSAYVGYTGAHQSFDGVSGNQNGGVVGVTGALYKGGFFSGLTVNANAGFSNLSTPYGKNDFFMMAAGVASKTGYNWELGKGKFIIQPSWLMSYTFVNAFDPSDIMGYKVDAKALHGVQLVPGIKLMANLPMGWQPYLLFDFRFNLGDKTHFDIGSMSIPETSVKPYVEYGLGMQKRWGQRFTGFGQFLARNGGRNGVGLNLGLRWSVGQGR